MKQWTPVSWATTTLAAHGTPFCFPSDVVFCGIATLD
jgi:hypothetical protein